MHAHTQTKRLPLLQHQAANRIKRKSHNTTHQHNSRRPPLERRKPLFVLIINQTQSDSTRRAKRLHATLTSRIHPHSHSPQAYVHQSTRPWGHRTVWRGDVCTCSPGPAHSEFRAVQSKECVYTHTHTHMFFCSVRCTVELPAETTYHFQNFLSPLLITHPVFTHCSCSSCMCHTCKASSQRDTSRPEQTPTAPQTVFIPGEELSCLSLPRSKELARNHP